MALSNTFKEEVAAGNVRKIRIMLKDSLLVDPTFERFEDMEKAASTVTGLYDQHDGRPFIEDPELWDDPYMDKLMVQIVGNFSRERLDHLMDVVRHLRPVPERKAEAPKTEKPAPSRKGKHNYQEQKHRDQVNGEHRGAKIAGGAVAGAIVGGIIGTVAEISVVGTVVVGTIVGSAIVTGYTNERN